MFERLKIGDRISFPSRTIDESVVGVTIALTGYTHPLFSDRSYLRRMTPFPARPLPGALLLAFLGGVAEGGDVLDDSVIALTGFDRVAFRRPAFAGDTLSLGGTVVAKKSTADGHRGFMTLDWVCTNERDEVLLTAEVTFVVRLEKPSSADSATGEVSPS